MKVKQLKLLFEFEQPPKPGAPYKNGMGELLPWEEPEYLRTHRQMVITKFLKIRRFY